MTNNKTLTFSQRVIKSKSSNICLYTGQDKTGREAWYFILLSAGKKEKFASECQNDIDLAEYGKVIVSGYGKEIPKETLAMIKEKYDFVLA
jgi:isocitrate dehydrogenase